MGKNITTESPGKDITCEMLSLKTEALSVVTQLSHKDAKKAEAPPPISYTFSIRQPSIIDQHSRLGPTQRLYLESISLADSFVLETAFVVALLTWLEKEQ